LADRPETEIRSVRNNRPGFSKHDRGLLLPSAARRSSEHRRVITCPSATASSGRARASCMAAPLPGRGGRREDLPKRACREGRAGTGVDGGTVTEVRSRRGRGRADGACVSPSSPTSRGRCRCREPLSSNPWHSRRLAEGRATRDGVARSTSDRHYPAAGFGGVQSNGSRPVCARGARTRSERWAGPKTSAARACTSTVRAHRARYGFRDAAPRAG